MTIDFIGAILSSNVVNGLLKHHKSCQCIS